MTLTAETLRRTLSYSPDTGEFTRLVPRKKGFGPIGSRAGSQRPDGYRKVRIDGKEYFEHRLAWLYMTGEWPPEHVDHINGNTSDNRWRNLRSCTRAQNMANAKRRADNESGFKGVCFDARSGKWKAEIAVSGRRRTLGVFPTIEDASQAYAAAAKEAHGEFARLE